MSGSAADYHILRGAATPLGARLDDEGCNFALFCPSARAVILCLFTQDTEEQIAQIMVPARTGHVWHVYLRGIKAGQRYGYRVLRETNDGSIHAASTDKLLIDPYATELSRPLWWDRRQYRGDSQFMMAKSVVSSPESLLPSTLRAKPVANDQRIVYEAHVKGLTMLHPGVPENQRGTYLGACHPSVLQHLVDLGVTCVQFMPLAAFMPEPFITEKGLTNYWGYNPVNFFAPEPRYASHNALAEVRYMVEQYHIAGLEVIVDVVFNHTAEGGEDGSVLSLRGTCGERAYLHEQSSSGRLVYSNYSGCGNTLNTSQPYIMQMIMDALRFWRTVIGVDGFRFDLAVCLGREPHQFTPFSGLLRAMQQDPVIGSGVLIAEPWDIGPGGYQVGRFSDAWLEVNDKFRDTVRAFWRGDEGLTADFATRLMGSRDLFHKGARRIHASVNNVTYHDGFTLQDLVSYSERHNLANGEQNRDGHGHNLSANYGVEGDTQDAKVLALRERQKRNLFATLLFSQGTPHVLGGDELSRSQQGNNNAYCQDNPISWLNWELNKRQQDFLSFCRYVIQLRKSSLLLSNLCLDDDPYVVPPNVHAVHWYRPDGSSKQREDWNSLHNKAFGLNLRGKGLTDAAEHWFLCINAGESDVRFKLPLLSPFGGWELKLDTRYAQLQEQPQICIKQFFLQAGRSLALFSYHEFDPVPRV